MALAGDSGERWIAARALMSMAIIANHSGNNSEALANYEESLRIFRELGDRRMIALTLNTLGARLLDQATQRYAGADLEHVVSDLLRDWCSEA